MFELWHGQITFCMTDCVLHHWRGKVANYLARNQTVLVMALSNTVRVLIAAPWPSLELSDTLCVTKMHATKFELCLGIYQVYQDQSLLVRTQGNREYLTSVNSYCYSVKSQTQKFFLTNKLRICKFPFYSWCYHQYQGSYVNWTWPLKSQRWYVVSCIPRYNIEVFTVQESRPAVCWHLLTWKHYSYTDKDILITLKRKCNIRHSKHVVDHMLFYSLCVECITGIKWLFL